MATVSSDPGTRSKGKKDDDRSTEVDSQRAVQRVGLQRISKKDDERSTEVDSQRAGQRVGLQRISKKDDERSTVVDLQRAVVQRTGLQRFSKMAQELSSEASKPSRATSPIYTKRLPPPVDQTLFTRMMNIKRMARQMASKVYAKRSMRPTYRMEPIIKFDCALAYKLIDQLVQYRLTDFK